MSKYEPLTRALRAAVSGGRTTVEMDFDEVGDLVGGLPPSAGIRQWWANSSQVQALAWRAADVHVSWVSLDHRRVRFSRGVVGGSFHDRGRDPARTAQTVDIPKNAAAPEQSDLVDLRVTLHWRTAGPVQLDGTGRPTFGPLPSAPGLYRFTLHAGPEQRRPRIYIGESDTLRRRLAGNYRNPGSTQQTNVRVNALLRAHLGSGGTVDLAIATSAQVVVPNGAGIELDLSRKSSRLLAENAALVLAHLADDADIENLP